MALGSAKTHLLLGHIIQPLLVKQEKLPFSKVVLSGTSKEYVDPPRLDIGLEKKYEKSLLYE